MEGTLDIDFRNSFEYMKVLNSKEASNKEGPEYSLFNFITQDAEFILNWDTGDIITGLKKLAMSMHALEDFQYDKAYPMGILLLFWLNSEMLSGEF